MTLFLLANCSDPESEQSLKKERTRVSTRITALPRKIKSPKDNSPTSQKEVLGKLLFYDPILSGSKDVDCASCHHPETGYAEFLDISVGVNGKGIGSRRVFNTPNDIPFVKRNAHTILKRHLMGSTL